MLLMSPSAGTQFICQLYSHIYPNRQWRCRTSPRPLQMVQVGGGISQVSAKMGGEGANISSRRSTPRGPPTSSGSSSGRWWAWWRWR